MVENSLIQQQSAAMLSVAKHPWQWTIQESCGLTHERQILEIPLPEGNEKLICLGDAASGRVFPVQRSQQQPTQGFLLLELQPFETLILQRDEADAEVMLPDQVILTRESDGVLIANSQFALRVLEGEWQRKDEELVPGPVLAVRRAWGAWRGRSYLDLRTPLKRLRGEVIEDGPLRVCYRYTAEMEGGRHYSMLVTVDAGQVFAACDEQFSAGSADQVVWDFAGDDLPSSWYDLNSTAGYTIIPLNYYLDERLARLAAWTQYSQQPGLSDGFACQLSDEDVVGFITMTGGEWRGNRHNFLEAWMRRWLPGDAESRAGMPGDIKADAQPGPELIPLRGTPQCEPHYNIEGWLKDGRRIFALLIASRAQIMPPLAFCDDPERVEQLSQPLEHFEMRPEHERYQAQQCLMRRIHVQRGMMPLSAQANMFFSWQKEMEHSSFTFPNAILEHHAKHLHSNGAVDDHATALIDYLQARVYGFWEGSGAAYSNCVVGRGIAPSMYIFRYLIAQGALTEEQIALCHALFSFLSYLYASDNYYIGLASMMPLGDAECTEPAYRGMANQNFYTDIINVFGTAACVFPAHPHAEKWQHKFFDMWHRQLQYHMYPESGVWEESHTYYHHVLHTVLPTMLRYRHDGICDEFANPDFQLLVGSALKQLTPPDDYFQGHRHIVPFGDHAVDNNYYRYLYCAYAQAFSPHNQLLAGHLVWAYEALGGDRVPDITPVPMPWAHEYVQGLGFMFRTTDTNGSEALLALRSGMAWGHHHQDDGSIQFFAHGRALVVDAVFSENSPLKVCAAGHSRWSPAGMDPMNYFWRFNRGWIVRQVPDGRYPYAVAFSPVYMQKIADPFPVSLVNPLLHTRAVVQVAPATYLIADYVETPCDQIIRFHLPETEMQQSGGGVVAQNDEACSLRLLPVTAGLHLTIGERFVPSNGKTALATREIAFATRNACSLMLLSADPVAAPVPTITADPAGYEIVADEYSLRIEFAAASQQLTLRDLRSAATQTIELATPSKR